MPNNDYRLIKLTDYEINDVSEASEPGYSIYADTLTFTARDKDGSISMDNRSANVTFYLEITVDKDLLRQRQFRIHLFDTRTFAIQPSGQISRDFIYTSIR